MSEQKITTVSKLKSLIEAIDLMSEEEEWTPTQKQWRRIKEMIETLEEGGSVSNTQYASSPTVRRPAVSGSENPLENGMINFPQVPSAIPADAPRAPTQSALTPPPVAQPKQDGGSSSDVAKAPRSPGL